MYSVYGMYSGLSARSTDSSTAIAGADEREAGALKQSQENEFIIIGGDMLKDWWKRNITDLWREQKTGGKPFA